MHGALGDPWPLMPEAPALAFPDVRLEHGHGAHLSGCLMLHRSLIAGRTIAGRSAGWPESVHWPVHCGGRRHSVLGDAETQKALACPVPLVGDELLHVFVQLARVVAAGRGTGLEEAAECAGGPAEVVIKASATATYAGLPDVPHAG
jgi:hypothetical protein